MLYKEYGYCNVPVGTILYREGASTVFRECMFFALRIRVASAFGKRFDKIQVWSVKQQFKILFMVLELDRRSWTKSAIVEIFNKYHPIDAHIDDLEIKHRDHQKRDKLISRLKENGVIGWLSSLENKIELELCLFPDKDAFSTTVELFDIIDDGDNQYKYLNALDKIDVVPSLKFFKRTKQNLKGRPFPEYAKWLAEDPETRGLTKEQARNHHLNLRTKLKI